MANGKTAVLGTGIMGAAMAKNLLASDFDVSVWNRSKEKAEPLSGDGATVADSASEAASEADFLVTMLPNADVTAEVVEGGVLDALAGGAVWVQTGTVGVEGCKRLQNLALKKGIAFIDAPVLGTRQPAEAGELVVLASGPEEVSGKVAPVFEAIGKKTLWVGPVGAGSRLKLVTNDWIVGLLATLAETLAVAKELGVDPQDFLGAIEGGPLDLPYAQMKSGLMISGDYKTSFPLKLARKDAGLVMDAAGDTATKVTEAAAAYMDAAIEVGRGEEDMAVIHEGVLNLRGSAG
ncbi:NAD(P)-dependent oxidoreductase [Rubrobacter indicoceani]|uniref:NAD(P)-dependent oxidoreductase n=1 Tax=Rubrobacter indicoceani TaxID=2051957 RepID=UPI000E5A47A8|nr:NAD(P)-dependent oxidoreductase [Rubrobacter indicoceani]